MRYIRTKSVVIPQTRPANTEIAQSVRMPVPGVVKNIRGFACLTSGAELRGIVEVKITRPDRVCITENGDSPDFIPVQTWAGQDGNLPCNCRVKSGDEWLISWRISPNGYLTDADVLPCLIFELDES